MKPLLTSLAILLAVPALAAPPVRPADDVARDAARKPDAMVAFAMLTPGKTVADIIPGGGYFTRVFSAAVGSGGKVVAVIPPPARAAYGEQSKAIDDMAAAPGSNIVVVATPADPAWSGKLDVAWTAQNYHDLHNGQTPEQVMLFNKAVLGELKPGGYYVIVDHAAPGTGLTVTKTLHRIDPEAVKAEVVAAGFVFDGESKVLANPADPHTAVVFDPTIRGKTDQFVFRFRKP